MRILVTGATGFVGSAVVRQLASGGPHRVAALVRPSSDTWRIDDLLPRLCVIRGSMMKPETWEADLCAFRPDAVAHLAWDGVFYHSSNVEKQSANVVATMNLVRLAQRAGATHWVGVGSQAEYGPCQARIDEQTPLAPTTDYGRSKVAAFLAAQEMCRALSLRFAWLRLFSSYGPGDKPQWMIPYVITSLLRGESPDVSAGEQRWDHIFRDDAAEAIVRTLECDAASGAFNLGSGRVQQLRTTIEQIRDMIDPRLPIGFGMVPYRPHQVMHLEADISRLCATTDWSPRTELAEGLRRTIAWHRKMLANPPALPCCA